ncbi:MAG TPA: GNAT family N-acetyltransferase [Solirubrobacteraceae bacterium]|jgi:GNAT superfamily N-acetyltransferase|nr:GNAT family N-acetyltransferase [Solirubrobacteraceae bacterium]
MRRSPAPGYELDDDRERIDVDAVHQFLAIESYWGLGRSREVVVAAIEGSIAVTGLYFHDKQVGFARVVGDGVLMAYLADVYVLIPHRRKGLGIELVRFTVEEIGMADMYWALHTADAERLYAKFGFQRGPIGFPIMERAWRPPLRWACRPAGSG